MVALPSGLCVSLDFGRRYQRTRVSGRVALLRSIPPQGSQLLSASQALCEELSCNYLALVPRNPNAGRTRENIIEVSQLLFVGVPPRLRSFSVCHCRACLSADR
jgi:hypothetical protein